MTKYLTLALALTLAACGGEDGDTTVIYMGGAATGGTTAETGGTTAETGGTTTGGTTTGGTTTGGTTASTGGTTSTGGTSEVGGTATGGTTTGGTSTTLPCDAAYLSLSQEEKCYQYAMSVEILNPNIVGRTVTQACGTIKDQCGTFINCGTCGDGMGCGIGDFFYASAFEYDGKYQPTPGLCQGACRALPVAEKDRDCGGTKYFNWKLHCSEGLSTSPGPEHGTCKQEYAAYNTTLWCCNK